MKTSNILLMIAFLAIFASCKKKTSAFEEELAPTPNPPAQTSNFSVSFALIDNTTSLFSPTYSNARKIAYVKNGNAVIDSVIISSNIYNDNGSADYCTLSPQYKQTSTVKTQGSGNRIYIYEGSALLADAELKSVNSVNSLNDIKYYGDVGSCYSIPGCPTLLAPAK